MSRLYISVISLLAVCAAAATVWLAMLTAEPAESNAGPDSGALSEKQDSAAAKRLAEGFDRRGRLDPEDGQLIWEQNLFSAQRRPLTLDAASVADPHARSELRLLAVGRIGSEAAAVIKVTGQQRGQNVGGGTGAASICRVGDAIANSGYRLDSIALHEAVVVKGSEERVLRLDRNDNTERKPETADTQHSAPETAATMHTEAPPDVERRSTESREERIRRAAEIRRRVLERRSITDK
jgi:hypothetical protein